MLKTRLCAMLGIEYPIISAPLGPNLSDVDLVAAVSAAGGLGILQAQLSPPDELRSNSAPNRQSVRRQFYPEFSFGGRDRGLHRGASAGRHVLLG